MLAIAAYLPAVARAARPGQRLEARVTSVVDGDTIHARVSGDGELAGEQKIRFIGMDTPEVHSPFRPVECFGRAATKKLTELIPPGTRVRLVLDVDTFDRYDRLLAYVYRRADGLFVNAALVRTGYAAVLTVAPNVAHVDELRKLERKARRAGRGLWSACGGPDTPA